MKYAEQPRRRYLLKCPGCEKWVLFTDEDVKRADGGTVASLVATGGAHVFPLDETDEPLTLTCLCGSNVGMVAEALEHARECFRDYLNDRAAAFFLGDKAT